MKRYYDLVILEEDSYLSNEKKRKRIARYKLCYQFSTILEQGLALEDIYDFYLHIADEQLALAGNGKDGLPLLTYGKFTVKKGIMLISLKKYLRVSLHCVNCWNF